MQIPSQVAQKIDALVVLCCSIAGNEQNLDAFGIPDEELVVFGRCIRSDEPPLSLSDAYSCLNSDTKQYLFALDSYEIQ